MTRRLVIVIASLAQAPTALAQQDRPFINGSAPAVSPDGRFIAFAASRGGPAADLFVIRSDGTGELRLTDTPVSEGGVRWMPDGRIKFEVFGPDTTRVFTIKPDGTGLQPLAAVTGREIVPAPDGRSIVYNAGRMPASRLARMALDGSGSRWLADSGQFTFNPAFSPDGRRMAFATFSGPSREVQVGVMNADGSDRRLLTSFAPADGSPQWPSWSPAGTRLAVQAGRYDRNNRAASTAHIWVVDVATGAATKLAAHDRPYLDETPSYFPDGRRIAFQSDRTGRMEIWVMNVDGTEARQITK